MTQSYQSGFRFTLTQKADPADTEIFLSPVPTVTTGRVYITDGSQQERINFTGKTSTSITGCTRGLSQTADPATAGTGSTWIGGSAGVLVSMHDQIVDKLQGNPALFSAYVYANTAARDAALGGDGVATQNYTNIKTTADGLFWRYNTTTGLWEDYDTGTTTPNASPTVAGKGEIPTTAQMTAGAQLGETGAYLLVPPSLLAAQIQSGSYLYGVDAGGDDAYVVALVPTLTAYTAGQLLGFKVTTTNTGACTVNFGPSTLNIKTIDGNDPQTGVIRTSGTNYGYYDGTNFVLLQEDFATTANRGVAEIATLAEQVARTDSSRIVTPEGLGAITQVAVLQTTRAANTADGTSVLPHGLTTTPKRCEVVAMCIYAAGGDVNNSISTGWSTGAVNKCTYVGTKYGVSNENISGNDGSNSIRISVLGANGESVQTGTIAFDATNVTITWDYTEDATASSSTINVTLFVHT